MVDSESLIDSARGDIGLSRQLKDTLKYLAENISDADLKRQIGEISAGRASMQDLMNCDGFTSVLDHALPVVGREMESKSDAELHSLAAAGEAVLERYRNIVPESSDPPQAIEPEEDQQRSSHDARDTTSSVVPGTRKPNRDLTVGPVDDLDDDDDRYFRESRDRGWLV